ncbi:FAD-dependent oxidoreductase [Arcticibacter eurypsychrophilus]|uniref:FAD-dependent oxidoreductase n=1 Tax=Arcticibacter eurypsychrophilus TaxID=1434752 RepID=UPI00084D90CE|nr:FAD-dependent oxidoreductase [Arcticibacter eurypsychrophilus]
MCKFFRLTKPGVLLISLLLLFTSGYAQTYKSGVVVMTASPAGIAAAIQSAHSGVKTILLDDGAINAVNIPQEEREHASGVLQDFLKTVEKLQKYPLKNTQPISAVYAGSIFKSWTDTIKNLTILRNSPVISLKKSGKGWEIILAKSVIKADLLVDASSDRRVVRLAALNDTPSKWADSVSYANQLYRTGIAALSQRQVFPSTLPLKSFLSSSNNLVFASPDPNKLTFASGQAAGSIAAYSAFFNTNTEHLNIRLIQNELLTYRLRLISFDDVSYVDSNSLAFQQIALTGVIKGKVKDGKFLLMPDSTVSSEEIRLPVKQYYSRSQIWFLDHKSDKLTLDEVLSLIKFSAQRGAELNKEVEKGWKAAFKLPGKFDLQKTVTRREFCVLLNAYLKPFDVTISTEGVIKR